MLYKLTVNLWLLAANRFPLTLWHPSLKAANISLNLCTVTKKVPSRHQKKKQFDFKKLQIEKLPAGTFEH